MARARAAATAEVADDYAILALIAALAEIPLDVEVRSAAASLTPIELRTLDAIHLASALTLGDDLTAVLTYGGRRVNPGGDCVGGLGSGARGG